MYLNHFAVNLKLTQHCKSTTFQLKNFKSYKRVAVSQSSTKEKWKGKGQIQISN